MVDNDALTSPVHDRHVALGAKMADFSGWQMPIDYPGGGVLREHAAVRENVGVFDVSHLGKALVSGPGAADFVNSCFTNDLARIGPGQAQYTMCCVEETGGVLDDLIQYLRSPQEVFLVPNAANTTAVVERLRAAAPAGVTVTDQHRRFGVLAVQGPKVDEVMTALGLPRLSDYMSFVDTELDGRALTVCRTGYTGEKGYELMPAWDDTPALFDALRDAAQQAGGMVCGLGARDTLRMEMGYALHGHELGLDITPNMARAGWAIGWDKESFWGKRVLTEQRARKDCRLAWGLLVTGRGIPRQDCVVVDDAGREIGVVTSGTMSPTLRQGIGLALLDRGVTAGDTVSVQVRGRGVEARVVRPPFVTVGVSG